MSDLFELMFADGTTHVDEGRGTMVVRVLHPTASLDFVEMTTAQVFERYENGEDFMVDLGEAQHVELLFIDRLV